MLAAKDKVRGSRRGDSFAVLDNEIEAGRRIGKRVCVAIDGMSLGYCQS